MKKEGQIEKNDDSNNQIKVIQFEINDYILPRNGR